MVYVAVFDFSFQVSMDSRKRPSPAQRAFVKQEPTDKVSKKPVPLPKCRDHIREDCSFWCKDCTMAVCMDCVKLSHRDGDHNLIFLESVIAERVQESLLRLEFIRDNIGIVESNVAQYKSEISYHQNQLDIQLKNLKAAEEYRDYPKYFDSNLENFTRIAKGEENVEIDTEVLAKFLQLLRKSDDELFWLKRPAEASCNIRSDLKLNKTPQDLCTVDGFSFTLDVDISKSNLILSCSYVDSLVMLWSAKIDFRISIVNKKKLNQSLHQTVVGHIFQPGFTDLELNFAALNHWKEANSSGLVPVFFEVCLREKNAPETKHRRTGSKN